MAISKKIKSRDKDIENTKKKDYAKIIALGKYAPKNRYLGCLEQKSEGKTISGNLLFLARDPNVNFSESYFGTNLHIWPIDECSDGLPEWKSLPYCRNGLFKLERYTFVELDPEAIHPTQICRSCLRRMEIHGYQFPSFSGEKKNT